MMDVSSDRREKYGQGSLRLGALLLITAAVASSLSAGRLRVTDLAAGWFCNAYLGSIGAAVNVEVLGSSWSLALLAGGALLVLLRVAQCDYATVIILLKTLGADALAGKIDTLEWRLSLAFALSVPLGCWCWFGAGAGGSPFAGYARILPILFVVQLISECGDNKWENLKLFRHRYAFEALTVAAMCLLSWSGPGPLSQLELRVVWLDLLQCFFYRLSNWLIIVGTTSARDALLALSGGPGASVRSGATLQYLLCWVVARLQGKRIVRVRDAAVARQVFRSSTVKGYCLERCIATPAWAPILSLESVDGGLWRSMRADFNTLMKQLPPAGTMQEVSRRRADELAASGRDINADAIVELAVASFLDYLFAEGQWSPDALQVFAAASWEWRKEIAARGRGDPRLKRAAVELLVGEMLPRSRLWGVFGERWRSPQAYSLLLQPFIVSPAINVSDCAVAMAAHPGAGLDDVLRRMHPIPILERFVERDVVLDGRVVVPAQTQVMIFPADLQECGAAWNPFGEGPRACPGAHLARPLLLAVQQRMLPLPRFVPGEAHRYSGRNNDDTSSPGETAYLARVIGGVVARLALQRLRSCFAVSAAAPSSKVAAA